MSYRIRMAKPSDAAELLAVYTPYVLNTNVTFEYVPPTVEEFRARIEGTLAKGFPYLTAEGEEGLIGYLYVSPLKGRAAYEWAVESSIYVKEEARGRKVGRNLYRVMEELLRRQHIVTVNACVTFPNPASQRFHEEIGYRLTAHLKHVGYKRGQWMDTLWLQKWLTPLPAVPDPVVSFTEIKTDDLLGKIFEE